MRFGILLFLLAPLLAMGACSCMDQAGSFAVSGVANGTLSQEQAGEFLLMTAASDMEANARLESNAWGWLETIGMILGGGVTGLGAVRFVRKAPLRSGSGAAKAAAA